MTTALELLLRRMVLERGNPHARHVAGPAVRPPLVLAEGYAAELRRQVLYLEHALLAHVEGLLPKRQDSVEDIIGDLLDQMAVVYRRQVGVASQHVSEWVSTENRRTLSTQWQSVLGIDYPSDGDATRERLEQFRTQNVALITQMTEEELGIIRTELRRLGPGARIDQVRQMLMDRMGVCRSRATLIARDQVLKLNSNLTQIRHEEAGVVEYDWISSNDERVRHTKWQDHRALHGTRHRWDSPPIVNKRNGDRAHPGEYFQCRCTASPVFDLT